MSNRQLYFLDVAGVCPRCGIAFREDYELGVYSARVLASARRRGLCVACNMDRPSMPDKDYPASAQALKAVWECMGIGLGMSDGSNLRCVQDTWPTMEEFEPCLNQ